MNKRGLLLERNVKSLFVVSSIALLSGCVASTIDTPQGFVGAQPTTADVLALENSGALPTPDARPTAQPSVAVAQAAPAVAAPTAEIAQTTPTPPAASAANTQVAAADDAPTARIEAAQSAPVAGNAEDQNAARVAAAKTQLAPVVTAATSTEPKNRGLLSALFGSNNSASTKPVPKTEVAKAAPKEQKRVVLASASASGSTAGLPGFDKSKAIGINQASDDNARPVQVASAAGLARLTPNGLKTQHSGVDVKCFKPALVKVLKAAERKFGSPVIVTSGYRSPARNKKIRGAKNSLHIYCSAADVQIKGVSKWTLAKYFRSMSGRGGVGTYCHTKSVHVDIGPKRDWNWRCKRG